MKAEIELSVDEEGNPIIIFTHDEISKETEQKLIGVFTTRAKESGIKLINPRGTIGSDMNGKRFSSEYYEIVINDDVKPDEKEIGCCMSCSNWRVTQGGKGECGILKVYTDEGFFCKFFQSKK